MSEWEEPAKRARDWKGIAALITALVGATALAWTITEQVIDRATSAKVAGASYEALADKLDEAYRRIAVLEARTEERGRLFGLVGMLRGGGGGGYGEVASVAPAAAMPPPPEVAVVVEAPEVVEETHAVVAEGAEPAADTVEERDYPAAGLPSFQAIQRKAVTLDE